jgi:hypothetical protein
VEAYCVVAGKIAQVSLLRKSAADRCWMALGSVAVQFALLAEKTVDFHKAVGFGMVVGNSLVERNIRLVVADIEDVVEGLARRTGVAGKQEFGSGLAQELEAG